MAAPKIIAELVERFERNRESYQASGYNETQLRREFLDPLFKALGWDIDNERGHAEAYKDVIHEDAIKVGGATKAPDYCFRIGGRRIFFLEAKKPSVNLRDDVSAAFQLRRYAWSAKLPLSVLSDFEELAVYDCRIKPDQSDKPSVGRVLYFTYKEYVDRWDELSNIFSREAVLKGSFDKFAESTKLKRGTAEVDTAFLEEIESWRDLLARNFALRNADLDQRDLNFAVQRTIDRLIFLRMCEDRGIENYGQLMTLLNGEAAYRRLLEIYDRADERYNSGLFHFHAERGRAEPPDELTTRLTLDDKPLKEIVRGLYYPDSPYEFSVLPAEILGQVYEQFLGKVIRLTGGHRAVVEDKPEVKKAGGVFYTPAYIVDYIVRETVGKLVDGKTPKQVSKLRVLDPACGSGSFLVGALHFLLDWHRDWYVDDGTARHTKEIYQGPGGQWLLTTAEKKRILLNNIFGVDIDSQAVEVTKLSLLLKVLERENRETLERQLRLLHERALPDLGNNIKCGNSLIGPDFYDQRQMTLLDEDEQYRINAFDWRAEFAEVFKGKDGGFDAVIGNPPWGAFFSDEELEYHRIANRPIIVRMIDSFMFFVYQMARRVRGAGRFGMILPDVILYQGDNEKLRAFILDNYALTAVLNLGDVFHKVTRPAAIITMSRDLAISPMTIADFADLPRKGKAEAFKDEQRFGKLPQASLAAIPGLAFVTKAPERYQIWETVKRLPHTLLGDLVDSDGIQRGVSPDLKDAFIVESAVAEECELEAEMLRRVVTGGKEVRPFHVVPGDKQLIYTTRDDNFDRLPNIRKFIDQFKGSITCREVREKKHPIYSLHRPRDERIFTKPVKALDVITADRPIVAIDRARLFATDGLYVLGISEESDLEYVVATLNSTLFRYVYRLLASEEGRVLAQVKPAILCQLPIRSIALVDTVGAHARASLIEKSTSMDALSLKHAGARNPDEKTRLLRQLEATGRQIDKLVYELYGLSDDEIAIIEAAAH